MNIWVREPYWLHYPYIHVMAITFPLKLIVLGIQRERDREKETDKRERKWLSYEVSIVSVKTSCKILKFWSWDESFSLPYHKTSFSQLPWNHIPSSFCRVKSFLITADESGLSSESQNHILFTIYLAGAFVFFVFKLSGSALYLFIEVQMSLIRSCVSCLLEPINLPAKYFEYSIEFNIVLIN